MEEHQILDDWSAEIFVENNYEYYKNKWRDKPGRQNFASWNWPAFLFRFTGWHTEKCI